MIQKQTVYIPTKVEDEVPQEGCKVGIIINDKFDFAYWMEKSKIFDHHRQGLSHKQKDISHWLKPTEGYFFTPEQLKQLLEEYTNRIVENVKARGGGTYKTNEGYLESNPIYVDKESITTQLTLFLKEIGYD